MMKPNFYDYRILVVDDYPEIVELIVFFVETAFQAQTITCFSAKEAVSILQKDQDFDLVISDMRMRDGTGLEIYKIMSEKFKETPLLICSSESLDEYPELKRQSWVHFLEKPFDDRSCIEAIERSLKKNQVVYSQYLPVHISLLKKIENIKAPLFVKINEEKYVQVTQDGLQLKTDDIDKYEKRGLTHLYIESVLAENFIHDFCKSILFQDAWNNIPVFDKSQLVKLNTELLRGMAEQLGWDENLINTVQNNLQKCLQFAKRSPELNRVINQFQKIENLGYADHCTLIALIASGLATAAGRGDEISMCQLTFSALVHDMTLSDLQYQNKHKLINAIENKQLLQNNDVKAVLAHPIQAAEFAKKWKLCAPGADKIIASHHEKPNGDGFPMGLDASQIDDLSAIFIISEDFVTYHIEHFGEADPIQVYRSSARQKFQAAHFNKYYQILDKALAHSTSHSPS